MAKEERLSDAAQLYLGTVIVAGVLAVLHSLYILQVRPVNLHWFLLAGLTLLSGSFTIRIPTIPARLSVSETFVFATVLLFGPAAATMIVVLDSLVISLWLKPRSRRASRVLFNVAAASIAIWCASHAFYSIANIQPLSATPRPVLPLVGPLLLLAVLYFILNSALVALAVGFEKRVSAVNVWRQNFLWLSLNYFSGASVAALLLPYIQPEKPEFARVIGILLPLLLISYLTFKTAMGRVDDATRHLSELNRLYLSTIETLAMAIDAKDQITHGHIRRVQVHAVKLAKAMGVTDKGQIRAIEAAALLHDMGKLAVPEYILNKPGPLTPPEFERMKLHASVGADILSAISFPYPVVPIVRHHHENWDGTGYPDKLSGSSIPIGARILSVVDCFDALTSDRPYRPRLADADALRILIERRSRMYDPLVVDTFVSLHQQGGLGTLEVSTNAPFVPTISSAAASSLTPWGNKNRLDDIAASGGEMLALFELARELNSSMRFSEVSNVVVKHIRRIVPVSLSVLYKRDHETDELVAAYASGEHTGLVRGLRIPLGQRLTGWVGAHHQTIRNSDPVLDLGEAARSATPRLRSCLSTPMVAGDSLAGVLSLYSTAHDAFSEDHQRVMEVVAKQVAPVIQQALAAERASHTPMRDQLLTLPQLGQFELLGPVPGSVQLISLIYIDINGLIDIGESEGQKTVEEILSRALSAVRNELQQTDILFRLAEGDFVVVQLQTDKSQAAGIAERIRKTLESDASDCNLPVGVTIAVSVSSMPEDGHSVQSLLDAARQRILGGSKRADDNRERRGSVH